MTGHPVVDLRVLKNRSFSAGVFLISMLGFVLYVTFVLLPLYLQTLSLCPREALGRCSSLPWRATWTTKTDPRRLLAVGTVLGSITMFQLSGLNLFAGFWDIFWAGVARELRSRFCSFR
jgi:DHA2 family multidrug resistance protein